MTRASRGQALRDKISHREEARAASRERLEKQRRIYARKVSDRSVYQVLNQDKTWWDFEGEAHSIKAMSLRYKINLLGWLRRNARNLLYAYWWQLPYPNSNGEMAQEILERAWEQESEQLFVTLEDPDECVHWIETTPLYAAIQISVARGEDGYDGDDPAKLERYRAALEQRRQDSLSKAEEATWD